MVSSRALVGITLVAMIGTACFDPVVPAECKGAVCGEIMDLPEEGGGGPAGAGGMAAGGSMGAVGGAGGQNQGGASAGGGGAGPLVITIMSPSNNAVLTHGTEIDFVAEVTGGMPPASQLIWDKSGVQEPFGTGYSFIRAIPNIGSHDLTVRVMSGDTELAADSIVFDTQ